jgi:hypothetical protein
MMEEVIDITPEMMHKFYNNLENSNMNSNINSNNSKNKRTNEVNDKYSITEKYNNSKETKMLLLVLFVFPLIIYILSILQNNSNNYQKLH